MFKVKIHEPKPLQWWYQNRHKIDLEPVYQRHGKLWGPEKKACLIDSILNEYDMPKLYVADFNYAKSPLNEKRLPYAVIDGKQRLETVFQFFDGKLKLADNFKLYSNPTLQLGGLNYLDLKKRHSDIAAMVENYTPTIMSVLTVDEDRIDDLFVRLNSGLEINSAERRNAMPGIVPRLIRHIVGAAFFHEHIRFDVSRMSDYNVAAKLLLIESNNGFSDTKARNLDAFVKLGIKAPVTPFKETSAKVLEQLEKMSSVFAKRDRLLSSAGHIPVFYWLVKNHHRELMAIRPFLESFMKDFNETKVLIRNRSAHIDNELLTYYTRHRTSNDKGSMEDRYKILEARFAKFLKSHPQLF